MSLTYDRRNRATIEELAPNTKVKAKEWYEFCVKNKIDILIYDAERTVAEQKENMKNGVSQTMRSYHLVGQALDFVPIVKGKGNWEKYGIASIQKAIKEAKRLGFSWGGDWTSFKDKPHLEYKYNGYGTDKVLVQKKILSTYTIKAGDTLSGIAHGHGISLNLLIRENNIKNANRISTGDVLRIPYQKK